MLNSYFYINLTSDFGHQVKDVPTVCINIDSIVRVLYQVECRYNVGTMGGWRLGKSVG